VQEVTYSFSGGYWWTSLRMRVLPAAVTQPTRHRMQPRAASVGVDAGMGQHFATLNQALPGVTDEHGHIDAPVFLRQALKDLAVAQRELQLTEAGSKRRAKALVRVQQLHGRVAARRKTWQQHLAIALTEHAHLVGVETLSLKGMARRKKGTGSGGPSATTATGSSSRSSPSRPESAAPPSSRQTAFTPRARRARTAVQ
jgi:transposase